MKRYTIAFTFFVLVASLNAQSRAERNEARIFEQEMRKLAKATERKASLVEGYINEERRKGALLARTAAIEAWRDRVEQQYKKDISFGKYAHLYPVPAWPRPLQFFSSPNQCMIEYQISRANRSFTPRGGVRDVAALVVGDAPKISNFLWASARAAESGVTPSFGAEFLSDLADTELVFAASHVARQMNLSYALSFRSNTITLGIEMPFIEKMRHMRVWPNTTEAVRDQLRSEEAAGALQVNDKFRRLYGVDVHAFIEDVMAYKGMRFDQHVHQFSVGDTELFGTINFFPQRLERWQIGASLTIPTAKKTDDRFFYPLQLGNGGFVDLKGYASVLGKKSKVGYAHAMASVTYGLPATVTRRMPRYVTYANRSAEIYGSEISGTASQTSEPETTISAFAQQTTQVTLRPGAQVDLRFGSVIQPFVSEAVQADIYYHVHIAFADELHKGLAAELWYTDDLISDTAASQHQVGVQLSVQPDANFQFRCGLLGTLGGTSAPMTWVGTASLSCEW